MEWMLEVMVCVFWKVKLCLGLELRLGLELGLGLGLVSFGLVS